MKRMLTAVLAAVFLAALWPHTAHGVEGNGILAEVGASGELPALARAGAGAGAQLNMKNDPGGWRELKFGTTPADLTNAGVMATLAASRAGLREYTCATLPPFGGVPLRDARFVYAVLGTNGQACLVHVRFYCDEQRVRKLLGAFKRRFGHSISVAEEEGRMDTWVGANTMLSVLHLYGYHVQVDVVSTCVAPRAPP